MRQKASGEPPVSGKIQAALWSAEEIFRDAAYIREQSALDNPRADVYNKDKERRCPHNGQLPSLSVTLENMTAIGLGA